MAYYKPGSISGGSFGFTRIKPGHYLSRAYAGFNKVEQKYLLRKDKPGAMWDIYINDEHWCSVPTLREAKRLAEQHWLGIVFLTA